MPLHSFPITEKNHSIIAHIFLRYVPLCMLFIFGSLLGYALLNPFQNNLAVLFVAGVLAASGFECFLTYLQAPPSAVFLERDATSPFTHKHIPYIRSTLGLGFLAVIAVCVLHQAVAFVVDGTPSDLAAVLAAGWLFSYTVDFACSTYFAGRENRKNRQMPNGTSPLPNFQENSLCEQKRNMPMPENLTNKWGAPISLPDDDRYLSIVGDVLSNQKVQRMRDFLQHGNTDCLTHCISVSYQSYLTCLKYGLDAQAAARAGLLHDLFLYDWHNGHEVTGTRFHGFTHPQRALDNAEQEFELTNLEREIILRHMWPLTITPPRHPESYVVLYHDKKCSTLETLHRPAKTPCCQKA